MIITIASGKGGTGKTLVATSLALSLLVKVTEPSILFLDCDVEAPNAHLFLDPIIDDQQEVGILIPVVDEVICTHCGKCAEVCQYHAIAVLGRKTLVFPQLCHGCGSCTAVCPVKAISEILSRKGTIEHGSTGQGISFAAGVLDIGEPMAVPIIHQLKKRTAPRTRQVVIRDAPPGTSCPVVETMRGSDYLILVTEPTPFGLHDLKLAAQVAGELGIRTGVVVNRENGAYPPMDAYLAEHGLPILLRIPFERGIAEGVAQGRTLVVIHPEYTGLFLKMFQQITDSLTG
jgi:MinD superfamily P-loop ATPase